MRSQRSYCLVRGVKGVNYSQEERTANATKSYTRKKCSHFFLKMACPEGQAYFVSKGVTKNRHKKCQTVTGPCQECLLFGPF
jgi:hypothetical protein